MDWKEWMEHCRLCPRNCGVNRLAGQRGTCHMGAEPVIARAALHMWEEPCISGKEGSGAVFFSGCSLGCIFCQNAEISGGFSGTGNVEDKEQGDGDLCGTNHTGKENGSPRGTEPQKKGYGSPRTMNAPGKTVTVARLAEIFLELQAKKANNINLVTAGHFLPQTAEALRLARRNGLRIPVVYNSSGYEKPESLRMLEGLVDIYLPDFKYMDPVLAAEYSHAPDYPEVAKAALAEMVRQCPAPVFDGRGIMTGGVVVRQLLLPGHRKDAQAVIRYLYETYGDRIYLSMMSQYTPMPRVQGHPQLGHKVSRRSYEALLNYAIELGVENGFFQEGAVAKESFIPAFNGEGV